ncbi:MAG TPA: hypothetical protein VN739_10550 [Nitrososphaerales archaeon]|nr:hypothetical protein [Nitrososphaerales archaeon]
MRRPVTDIALLSYIAKKNAKVVSYTEATKACKSSSSASRALHQLIGEGILEPKPKLLGLRYVTQYVVTQKGKQVADLALQLTQLREAATKMSASQIKMEDGDEHPTKVVSSAKKSPTRRKKLQERNTTMDVTDSTSGE